jgi:hypothetical protein
MKRGVYYECVKLAGGRVIAQKVNGYIVHGFGLRYNGYKWIATNIQSGCKYPTDSKNKKQVIENTREAVGKGTFNKALETAFESKSFKLFDEDRHRQETEEQNEKC